MARSQSSSALKYVGAAAAAIAGGVAIGYLFGGARTLHPSVQPVQPPVSATLTPAPALNPSAIHPRRTNGNYTAPGAPHIDIQEESQPILRRTAPPSTPPADPEATQEAPPAPPAVQPAPADTGNTTPGSTDTSTPPNGTSLAGPANTGGAPGPAAPAGPTPAPADPDFEHVNTGGSTAPNATDPEAGQQGGPNQGNSGKVQFRVQTGAYTDESDARSVADQLRGQGYATSTRSERQGDHLVYKVQVGAYRSKNGASKAADDLQKKGFPAYVSPIGP